MPCPQKQNPRSASLTTLRTNLPNGRKSSCSGCLRAGDECILAGSRRGGDFSRFRRSRQKQSSTPSLGDSDAGHGLAGQQDGDNGQGTEDPIYAELTNPGDALQILARLAANDPQTPSHPNYSTSQDPLRTGSSSKAARTEPAFASDRTLESTQSPVFQPTLSETEILVIGVLGTDIVGRLVHQYETDPFLLCTVN